MERGRLLTAAGLLLFLASGAVAVRSVWALRRANPAVAETPGPLSGRLGGDVGTFDARYRRASGQDLSSSGAPGRLYRVSYDVAEGRAIAEVQPDGRVRQITVSRPRTVQDTWEPEPGDWTLSQAQVIAQRWLPADAAHRGTGTFTFQEREAGLRETYSSASLARAFRAAGDSGAAADAPRGFADGVCFVSYYQTRAGGVAFVLIGPA